MAVYYNEFDPNAAEWLRQLIELGLIAPGYVDERSIADIDPDELTMMGYTQCHFFAGIGVWSHALRSAGWSDDRPVWTGSCPCQPFSSAGKQKGTSDERHLWPVFRDLIEACRPAVVFGEQVSGKPVTGTLKSERQVTLLDRSALDQFAEENSDAWLRHVQLDLESRGYGVGAVTFPACGLGAPHQRKRLYWVAELENSAGDRREWKRSAGSTEKGRQSRSKQDGQLSNGSKGRSSSSVLDETCSKGLQGCGPERQDTQRQAADGHCGQGCGSSDPLPTNGYWRAADWLKCRDGKWRPVEPSAFPLADGSPSELVPSSDLSTQDVKSTKEAKAMRLKGYGNAIVATQAQAFIEAYLDV